MLTGRALLLDMDGTLVDSHAVVERCWTAWAREKGLDPARVLAVAHGRQGHATMAELLPDRPVEVNLAENRALLAQETADTEGIVPVAGAPAFLAALDGAPHALVTSADLALATARMGAAGLPVPAVRVTAEDVRASKPDPEGFLRGAALLGIDPADCIVFEDSEAGTTAARAAGMRVVGVGPQAARFSPDLQVDDLTTVTVTVDDEGIHLTV
ncbi:hydrolase [Tsukamurella pulmonis]|uniref:HAD-IA family hydrolase n=1 Tax=Tsukamurella pulmonis TaxID=47312 RepID=UPI001EDFABFB|nr:HAD-IA family hydrolase [Tsukamurella pulmonis]BDD83752.1 hydrolase [Tsukamurella pulmonis]